MEVKAGIDNSIYLSPGTVLRSQYRINSVIGQGGFGITYDGTDLKLNMHVAIKEYFPNPVASRDATRTKEVTCSQNTRGLYEHGLKNFLEEARNMARFAGEDNFVAVHDYFAENKTAYIIMEFVNGQNLKEYLRQYGRLTLEQTMAIMIPVMNALEKIHANYMIHRDISPSNIMILPDGRVRLLDFGAAKEFSFETIGLTTMSSVYKYGYSPIEQQIRGMRQGPFTDIYALCATMYEMLSGRIPAQPSQRAYEGAPLIPLRELGVRISKTQENAILKGLEINGSDRIQSVAELRAALCGEQSGEPVRLRTDEAVKRKGIIAILAIIAATLTVILAVIVLQSISFRRGNAVKNDEPAADNTPVPEEHRDDQEETPLQETAQEEQGESEEKESSVSDTEAYAVATRTETEEPSGDIPKDALYFDGNYFKVYGEESVHSWQQAEDFCEAMGGHLAVITSQELNDRLYRLCLESGYISAFFGYSDSVSEGHWKWVTKAQPEYKNWGVSEPNSASYDEDFAMFSTSEGNGKWNDSDFGFETSAFICEWGENNIDNYVPSVDIPQDALVYNGHSYYLFDNGMDSWAQAQQYCMSRGGDMAVINDAAENELLYQFMLSQGYSEAFFGYTDKENEGYWEWVASDTSTFEDWGMNDEGEREPNDDHPYEDYAEFYVGMIDGHWNDSQFGYNGACAYICEWNTTP